MYNGFLYLKQKKQHAEHDQQTELKTHRIRAEKARRRSCHHKVHEKILTWQKINPEILGSKIYSALANGSVPLVHPDSFKFRILDKIPRERYAMESPFQSQDFKSEEYAPFSFAMSLRKDDSSKNLAKRKFSVLGN